MDENIEFIEDFHKFKAKLYSEHMKKVKNYNENILHNKVVPYLGKYMIIKNTYYVSDPVYPYKYYGQLVKATLTTNGLNSTMLRLDYKRGNEVKNFFIEWNNPEMDIKFYDTEEEAKLASKFLNMAK